MIINLEELIQLRHELHRHPDLSGDEVNTTTIVKKYLSNYNPDEIIQDIGGNSFAVVYQSGKAGPVILIRCDLDALPINEALETDYSSIKNGVSHKCGHDGHMAIVSGLAQLLYHKRPQKGKVILLFQAEEETGRGAEKILNDSKFNKLGIDYAFALHNIPGYAEGCIILNDNVFASASRGMIIRLNGKSSHASEPEKGISPISAIREITSKLEQLNTSSIRFHGFTLITIVHLQLGDRAFGTSPGYAELMATLRSSNNDDMKVLIEEISEIIEETTKRENLRYDVEWSEEFTSLQNDKECVDIIERIAKENNSSVIKITDPFRFSEDFAHFTQHYKGAMFGLGSGIDAASLHSPCYDFPDNIIEKGVILFYQICEALVK